MPNSALNYLNNLPRLLIGNRNLRPLVITYLLTTHCNLNCTYCEDFGARRNAEQPAPLELPQAQKLLRLLRQATDRLILSGGEPLLYPDIEALVTFARREARFTGLTMLTNGFLLPQHEAVLDQVTRLVISLDTVDPQRWDETLRAGPGTAAAIHANIAAVARRRSGPQVIVHCVVTPETLPQARGVLDFCRTHGILFAFSPQSVLNWPRYELLVSDEYKAFIDELEMLKRRGAPILSSRPYLKRIRDFTPYDCYPLLAPRVFSDGGLAYPCRPIERSGTAQGGREINILEAGSWNAALKEAIRRYDLPPHTCNSCYQQCYAEPSLLQAHPIDWLCEWLTSAPARRGDLLTFAAG